jgi:hypothetical protein
MKRKSPKGKGLLIFLIIFITFLTLGYLCLKPIPKYLSGYLSKSEEVKANLLIVEGWLPDNSLKMVYEEFQNHGYDYIVTTGMKSTIRYFNLFCDGYLIFYMNKYQPVMSETHHHSIEIDSYSEMDGENAAHFNVFINDSLVADFFAAKQRKKYKITWDGDIREIDSITIQFDNDRWEKLIDRNLYVKEICIDNKITISYLNNSEYDLGKLDGKYRTVNNITSNADLARNRLIALGIDSSKITAISAERVRISRTLTSALAFRKWIETTDKDIKGINIISLGTHARRTWMTYNKILHEKNNIGIISLPDNTYQYSRHKRVLKTFRETLGIIYYWFILIPY